MIILWTASALFVFRIRLSQSGLSLEPPLLLCRQLFILEARRPTDLGYDLGAQPVGQLLCSRRLSYSTLCVKPILQTLFCGQDVLSLVGTHTEERVRELRTHGLVQSTPKKTLCPLALLKVVHAGRENEN